MITTLQFVLEVQKAMESPGNRYLWESTLIAEPFCGIHDDLLFEGHYSIAELINAECAKIRAKRCCQSETCRDYSFATPDLGVKLYGTRIVAKTGCRGACRP